MGEKFRKAVNAPHEALGRLRRRLEAERPDKLGGMLKREAGLFTTDMLRFIMWAAKYIALDNHLLRAMEDYLRDMKVGKNKAGQKKKLSSFMKKYPDFSAHMLYLLMAAMTLGGVRAYEHLNEGDATENVVNVPQRQITTYGEYMARLKPLEPMIIADLIAKEGVRVDKNGLHKAYKDSRGIWTIGFGSTVLKDGTSVKKGTASITTEEAYELARWHLENETFLLMYWYDVVNDKVNINTTEEAFAIASMMYNAGTKLIEKTDEKDEKGRYTFRNVNCTERSRLLRKDFKKYGTELPASVVLERFAQYPITDMASFGKAWFGGESKEVIANKFGNFLAGGKGLRWRRWLEAETFLGNVTPEMMLNCPVGGMYEFFRYVGDDTSNWFPGEVPNRRVNGATVATFREWIQAPRTLTGESLAGWKKAKDWLPPYARAMCEQGKCVLGNTDNAPVFEDVMAQEVKKQTYVTEFKEQYSDAISEYRGGNYAAAATKLEALIQSYPDNALLRNDLALTYNKLGRYNDAIAQVRVLFDNIGDIEQYGAAYYNAGQAREGLGQKDKALANYKLAVRYGNSRAQQDVTRLSSKTNRTAFADSSKKLRNNAHSADFDVMQIMRDENSMA